MTASCAGASISLSNHYSTATPINESVALNFTTLIGSLDSTTSAFASTALYNDGHSDIGYPGSLSASDGHHSGTVGGGISCSCTDGLNAGYETTSAFSGYPTRSYSTVGILRAMYLAYPDALTVTAMRPVSSGNVLDISVAAGSGAFSDSQSQDSYSGSIAFGVASGTSYNFTTMASASFSQRSQVGYWLKHASLTAVGEDTDLWRVLLRGFNWNALSLSQAGSVTVDSTVRSAAGSL